MLSRSSALVSVLALCALAGTPAAATSQGVPQEVGELRRRVASIRTEMARITAAADYAAELFTRDTATRFLISATRNPALYAEFQWHSGGMPDVRDADDPAFRGIVLMPVSAWETGGFAVATMVERWQSAGRPVFILASLAGKPDVLTLRNVIPNGAPDGARAGMPINEIGNVIAAWTMFVEFIGATTRHQWRPGIYISHLVPSADDSNSKLLFHARNAGPVQAIPAGRLGTQYLDRVDSLLNVAAAPTHQAMVQHAADVMRSERAAGHRLFVSACAHYQQYGLSTDTIGSPFRPVLARYEVVPQLLSAGARAGDVLLWFGYDGYDCPHIAVAAPSEDAGIKTVVVSSHLPARLPANVLASVPLGWRIPERIGTVPFDAEGVGSASSVDAMLHFAWLRRLVGAP
jgi:hypothetical protein